MRQLINLIVGACAVVVGASAFANDGAASAPTPACTSRCTAIAAPAPADRPRPVHSLAVATTTAAEYSDLGNVRRCREYHWKPGDVIPVEATMYRHITITLPEDGMDVVLGEKELWDMDWSKNIIFAKSLTPLPQGRIGAITAVGRSGNTYEFEVHRVDRPSVQCVTVKADGSMINHTAWQSGDAQQGSQAREQALTAQIARLNVEKAELAKDGDRKAREAIKMYRSAINTNYKWSNADGWYAAGGDIIESVHDDGRFTYVRLKSDNRGLMTIQAEIDGKKEILESMYDANTRTHKINGIFPKFVMRAGDSELTITREGA